MKNTRKYSLAGYKGFRVFAILFSLFAIAIIVVIWQNLDVFANVNLSYHFLGLLSMMMLICMVGTVPYCIVIICKRQMMRQYAKLMLIVWIVMVALVPINLLIMIFLDVNYLIYMGVVNAYLGLLTGGFVSCTVEVERLKKVFASGAEQ